MKMHHCETNLKILERALPPLPIPLPLGARGTRVHFVLHTFQSLPALMALLNHPDSILSYALCMHVNII